MNFWTGKGTCVGLIVAALYVFFWAAHFHLEAWWALPTFIVCVVTGIVSFTVLVDDSGC